MTPYWLLELTIDGRVYRWSTTQVEVDGLVYQAGLAELAVEVGADQVSVTITDPSVDWPALVRAFDGASAALSRWVAGRTIPMSSGELRVTSWGDRSVPLHATITRRGGDTLGTSVPDTLARVSTRTWPILDGGGNPTGDIGDLGRSYPVVFGCPGFKGLDDAGDERTPEAVMPVPLGQRSAAPSGTFAVISEDGALQITGVRARNQETGGESDETVFAQSDQLYRSIRVMSFGSDSTAWPFPSDSADLYVGFKPSTGGGPRSAYEVLVYCLSRWGGSSVDWSRIPEMESALSRFLVDTWIDDPATDPWTWFEGAILRDLPAGVRTSDRGLYLVEQRYLADGSRQKGPINVDQGDAAQVGTVTFTDTGPYNEFTAQYRPSREGDWGGHSLLTGREGVTSIQLPLRLRTVDLLDVATSGRCTRSVAQYGSRPAEPVSLDWCWDQGTSFAVLQWMAERDALPSMVATYLLARDGDQLEEGDEVLLTDSRWGFDQTPAIVMNPPELSSAGATIDFRIPA